MKRLLMLWKFAKHINSFEEYPNGKIKILFNEQVVIKCDNYELP